jgi:hypothetical protein
MAGDRFGNAVSLSSKTVVVGAYRDDGVDVDNNLLTDAGSVHVFRYDGTSWNEEAGLTAGDLAARDRFGFAVAVSGNTLVVGSPYDDDLGSSSGAAYVFRYDGATWVEEAKLLAADLAAGDKFGNAVAIDGDTLVVGAPYHDAGENDSGAAYVFRYDGATWGDGRRPFWQCCILE